MMSEDVVSLQIIYLVKKKLNAVFFIFLSIWFAEKYSGFVYLAHRYSGLAQR